MQIFLSRFATRMPYEHARSDNDSAPVDHRLRALTCHAGVGLDALVSATQTPHIAGDSFSVRLLPRFCLSPARGPGTLFLPRTRRISLLRSSSDEDFRRRRSVIARRSDLRSRRSLASELL